MIPRHNMNIMRSVQKLVVGMDDEEGIPTTVCEGVRELVDELMGTDSLDIFNSVVKAQDDRWYLPEGEGLATWNRMYDISR